MNKVKNIRWWQIMTVVWTFLAFAIFFQIYTQYAMAFQQALVYVVLVIGVSVIFTHFQSDLLLSRLMKRRQIVLFVLLAFLICLVQALVYAVIDIKLGAGDARPFYQVWVSFIISAVLLSGNICGLRFYRKHAAIEKKHRELQTAHLEAELKLLRDQVNPHFLFNVINSIHVLMKKDMAQANAVLLKFSDMLRHHLYDSTKEYILLREEIAYLQNYVNVEKIRWGNDVQVECEWIDVPEYYQIAPFMLSPFVENAFKYVSHDEQDGNHIRIRMNMKGPDLLFRIENTFDPGIYISKPDLTGGIGLANVKKRLLLIYPDRHELKIETGNNIFSVTLSIQVKEV